VAEHYLYWCRVNKYLRTKNSDLSNALSQNSIKREPVEVRILIKSCY
jgi:hypothetical protein